MLSPTRALGCTIAFWNGAAGGDGAKPTATPRMKAGLGCLPFLLSQSLGGIWEVAGNPLPAEGWAALGFVQKVKSGMLHFSS